MCFLSTFNQQALDGELHSRLRKYFMTFCTAEIEASTFTKMCAEKVLSNSEKVKYKITILFPNSMNIHC